MFNSKSAAKESTATQEAGQVRAVMLPAPGMPTLYANGFQTSFGKGEILLTACVSRHGQDAQGPVLTIQPQQAIGMSPESARRLVSALTQVINQYEQKFGKIAD